MTDWKTIGFIGLGVMGEPMCRHLAEKSGLEVVGMDIDPVPLVRLETVGVKAVSDINDLVNRCDVIMLSLPSGAQVEEIVGGPEGLMKIVRPGQMVVDLGTTPVSLTRDLFDEFASKGVPFADAPVSRTRAAAEAGKLSILVGAESEIFAAIQPLLGCFAEEVTHCGGAGAGQIVKQLNNMVLTETVVALAEALSVGRRAGLDDQLLFETLTKCSADSFALRNHGMKALLPNVFPERAFSTAYMLKDVEYALQLASQHEMTLPGAETARALLQDTIDAGYGDNYFPNLIRMIDGKE